MYNVEVEGIRQRVRPKKTWWDCVKNDMESLGLSQKDAQSRNKWNRRIKGTTSQPGSSGKMAVKTECVCVFRPLQGTKGNCKRKLTSNPKNFKWPMITHFKHYKLTTVICQQQPGIIEKVFWTVLKWDSPTSQVSFPVPHHSVWKGMINKQTIEHQKNVLLSRCNPQIMEQWMKSV